MNLLRKARPSRSFLAALALLGPLSTAPIEGVPAGGDRALERLAAYVRLNTSNPPGREAAGAAFLARVLNENGFATERYVSPGGRVSLTARLPATGPGSSEARVVVLLHHLDVVPAGPGWSRDPFGATVEDGKLWGRGAIDTKSLGIAHLEAFLAASRVADRKRELLFLAVADEEAGGKEGVGWLLERHPRLFDRVEAVLNEGGQNRTVRGRTLYWGIEIEQKRPLWLELLARGRGGHGSMATVDSAAHELVRALGRVLAAPPRWRVSPATRRMLERLAAIDPQARRLLDGNHLSSLEQGKSDVLLPGMAGFFLDSLQVTRLEGSERVNVVPGEARAQVDIRLLPDTDQEAYLSWLRDLLGPGIEVRILLDHPPSPPADIQTEVFSGIASVLEREAPVVPVLIAGITDSRYFRARGIPAYGFQPFELEGDALRTVHGPDEHIPVRIFESGVERMRRVVLQLVTADGRAGA